MPYQDIAACSLHSSQEHLAYSAAAWLFGLLEPWHGL